ncbi:hypothetical protein [Mesorhizobium sp. SP-1A]|uniref:hypothetical protein n=1 Tax=Mesorhizobium sp. SP-1A TaxID=3077840 RepID=UPI0028F725B0|nr:hypothetical protein [Mesorhizobium sp. SP-1A]
MQSDNFERDHYVYASLEVLETLVVSIARRASKDDAGLMKEIKTRLDGIRENNSHPPETRWGADQQLAMQGALSRIGARLDLGA